MASALIAVLLVGAGSWMLRAGLIVLPAGRTLALRLDPWLTYARPAVLASLLATATAAHAGSVALHALLLGLTAAGATARLTRNLGWGLLAGAAALLLL